MKKLIAFVMLVWLTQTFKNMDDVVQFLNQLPAESAKAAKVLPSKNATFFYVVYPQG